MSTTTTSGMLSAGWRRFGLWCSLSCSVWCAAAPSAAESFGFAAIGDMPYYEAEPFDRLIERINAQPVRFTIHVGDIKSGGTVCSDETFAAVRRQFMAFDAPLVYTPGDNEWTDCHRKSNGAYDPLERLQTLRRMFFSTDTSFGRQPVALERQSRMAGFSGFPENQRWHTREVSFATIHLVGSNNNLQPELPSSSEFAQRNEANIAWMRSTFAEAKKKNHRAIVFAMQADIFFQDPRIAQSGVADWMEAFRQEAAVWGKPILLIQGDTHRFISDRPFIGRDPRIAHVQRIVVPGDHVTDAVLIDIDTSNADKVFSIRLLNQ